MDKDTKEITDILNHILAKMATKDDIAALDGKIDGLRREMQQEFASIRGELRDIRQRLDALEEAARNSVGLTKEIDHILERVRAIEKHLGIQYKIAA